MLFEKRSPGPPWLPIPGFASSATVVIRDPSLGLQGGLVAALMLVDRSFAVRSTTPWILTGSFGHRLGGGHVVVPNGAEYWALAVDAPGGLPPLPNIQPADVFDVRWELHL